MNTTRNRRIITYYGRGFSLRETSAHFRLSIERVRQIVRAIAPTAIRPAHDVRNSMALHCPDTLKQQIVAYYKHGHSVLKTAARFGMSEHRIKGVVSAAKAMRPPGRLTLSQKRSNDHQSGTRVASA